MVHISTRSQWTVDISIKSIICEVGRDELTEIHHFSSHASFGVDRNEIRMISLRVGKGICILI